MTSPEARDAILANIRASRQAEGQSTIESDYASIARDYHRHGALDAPKRIALLEERLRDYGAGFEHSSPLELPEKIAATLAKRGKSRLVIPDGFPSAWLPPNLEFIVGDALSALDLDHHDGVLTQCTVAIAVTGTLVLQNVPGQGPRKLSLIPDYHLCIVNTDQVVETVPEALDRIAKNPTLPTTFISGPSATADIEMTRIQGVHGPRSLDVILVL